MARNYTYDVPNTEPLELSGNNPLMRRKELIYAGDFEKRKDNIRFSVDERTLQHWHNTFVAMSANGVEVPVPKEHTTDPDLRRGTVKKTEVALNKRGIPALFGYIEFKDEESLKLASASNVSIFSPNEWTDGRGNLYHRPILHVAITDYPTIPGLEKFEAIALSLTLAENSEMALRSIAKKLGIDEKVEDAKLEAAISTAVDALIKKVAASASDPPTPGSDPANPPSPPVGGTGGNPTPTANNSPPAAVPVITASMVNLLRDNRSMKLEAMVKAGNITPAVRDELQKSFCNDNSLSLSLSNTDAKAVDAFDATLAALAKNDPVKLREQTGPQATVMALSDLDPATNPLVKNAEARALAAKN